jgi:polyvinyl alcohol dehydrogenase (cytochrome)
MSDSVLALDLKTGRIKWHYQALAADMWNLACPAGTGANCPEGHGPDYDFGAGAVLARGRGGTEYVLAGQKSGWVFALNPANGQLAWKRRVGKGGGLGGVLFGMAAADGRLFVPISDYMVSDDHDMPPQPGVHALDIATGDILWRAAAKNVCGGRPLCNPGYSGAITTTSGLVLAGGDDGHLRIFDAATGGVVWDTDTARDYETVNHVPAHGGSIGGGAAPIAFKGDLIVPSGYGFSSKMPGNLLLVFGR